MMSSLIHDKHNQILFSLLAILGIYIIFNMFGLNFLQINEFYILDLFLRGASITTVIITGFVLFYFKKGNHGKAWMLFFIGITLWMIGENTWNYEYEYDVLDPTTYISDIFWILAYPFIFAFEIKYIEPFRKGISKKLVAVSTGIAFTILIPCIMMICSFDEPDFESWLLFSYSVFDVLLLIPAIIGVFLFFKGRVSGIWNLIFIGIVLDSIANFWYSLEISESAYGVGSFVDMLYVFGYVVFIFGVWKNIEVFSYNKESNKILE